ncbi:MAG: endopeptidase [Acidobacteriia bacterium]|nr:endopeptidase [Terriglobia bacterium]
MSSNRPACAAVLVVLICLLATVAHALQPTSTQSDSKARELTKPDLRISTSNVELSEILPQLPNRQEWDAFLARYGADVHVFVDPRSGRPTNILGHFPLLPGDGVRNTRTLDDVSRILGSRVAVVDAEVVGKLVLGFVEENRKALNIDTAQLGKVRATRVTDDLWQVSIGQEVDGIPVRYGRVTATLSHGNLVTLGASTWLDVRTRTLPAVSWQDALETGFARAGGRRAQDRLVKDPALEIVPYAPSEYESGEAFAGPVGKGIGHRLVWSFEFARDPDPERWEALVDAETGELTAFEDKNLYVDQKIVGGAYPLTDTEVCPTPDFCGEMQPGTPMPYADTGLRAPANFTGSGGVFDYTGGNATTTLSGKYIRVLDTCGPLSATALGSVRLGGSNGQHDCVTPGSGGAGNTPASRSAFYELNRIAEQARGWLPDNTWLKGQLTANVNLDQTCNAFYDYVTVNFFKSGGGCRNTGEIAAIFDHEWGHGLDDNDAGGLLSNSSEAYADVAAIYRDQASCVGYGFWSTYATGCPGTSDGTGINANEAQVGTAHCDTDCSGLRDADWAKHVPNTPDTAVGFVCSSCVAGSGPCGRETHCAAAPVRQAAWDLVARDLRGAPFRYDSSTAFLVGNKLFYQGSGNVGAWHACTCKKKTSDGCASDSGYMQWLAADDDDGNLGDGTPHMTAIQAAFNRHGIACGTPTPRNSGCAAGPATAPVVTAIAGDERVSLSWSAVSGASRYWVLRTEGQAGCDFGKVNLTPAGVTGTAYEDTGLLDGRSYAYNVVAVGSSSNCFGPASPCVAATPVASCAPPDPPSLLAPPSGSTGVAVAPTLDWSDVSGALSYDVEVATDPAFDGIVASSEVAGSAWSISPPLDYAVTYYWRARTISACDPGAYGVVSSFTTLPPPPGTASYDPTRGAPRCSTVNPLCDSSVLLRGRDGLGPEANAPNTIAGACADGTSGAFHVEESSDRIRLSTVDAGNLREGKTVRIETTVWADPARYTSDRLDLYHTASVVNPSWVLLGTLAPSSGGAQVLSSEFNLPSGLEQAIRAQFRYGGSPTPCSAGAWDDHDDLVFAVDPGCGVPTVPALASPGNGAIDVPIAALLDWSDSSGSTSYEVQVATDSAFGSLVRSESGLASSAWTVAPALDYSRTYYWRARGVNGCGAGSWSAPLTFTTTAVPVPDFSLHCGPSSLTVPKGQSGAVTCTVSSINGYAKPVTLTVQGVPAKVTYAFAVNPVLPQANGSANSVLTLTVSSSAKTGSYGIFVNGADGVITRSSYLTLTVSTK